MKNLAADLFSIDAKEVLIPKCNRRFLVLSSKNLVEFFLNEGLKTGNKIKNQVTMPQWVWTDEDCLKTCLRGLIDTDGSIFRMSNKDPNLLRISFTNYNKRLLNDARQAFIKIGFSPSKIIDNKRFYLSRQKEIKKYLKEIGFSNTKHKDRLHKFINSSVV